ncbi:MAG: high-affinity branched-chain amino acid ABC transporter permease LivM [Rhodospirillaceae bacterium]|nr:high-affinity branched-chain amino acid ABC transporter permease LivM [Rhodospirillaceae bacterium]
MLAITMVGIHLETVLGGLAIATRFADVGVAVVFAFIGRLALVAMREGHPLPALIGATAAAVLGVFVPPIDIVAAILQALGAEAPTPTPVLQVMQVAGGAILAVRAAWLVWRQRGSAGRRAERGRSLDAFAAGMRGWTTLIGPIAIVFAIALPFIFDNRSRIDLATLVLTYIMLAWGLNIIVGLAGLLDLGYVAFYAVGAYSYALLGTHFGWSFWICLPLAGVLASSAGLILGFPVLRLRGDYFAIVTLGFGEIIRVILLNWFEFTGGPDGISGIARPSFFGLAEFDRSPPEGVTAFHELFGLEYNGIHRVIFLYYLILVLALFVNFVSMRVRRLPIGRAWEALREDDIACQSLGINRRNIKLAAFMFSAGFGGVAGSFFATRQGFISPESFQFIESAIILAIVVLGGMGSQAGIVLAAVLMIGMPEIFRDLEQYRMLAFGALMVVIMVWRPRGLLSHRDPSVRLHPPPPRQLWPFTRLPKPSAAPAEKAAGQ